MEENNDEDEEDERQEEGNDNEDEEGDEEEACDEEKNGKDNDNAVTGNVSSYSEKLKKALMGDLNSEFPENVKVVRIFTSSTFTGKYAFKNVFFLNVNLFPTYNELSGARYKVYVHQDPNGIWSAGF